MDVVRAVAHLADPNTTFTPLTVTVTTLQHTTTSLLRYLHILTFTSPKSRYYRYGYFHIPGSAHPNSQGAVVFLPHRLWESKCEEIAGRLGGVRA